MFCEKCGQKAEINQKFCGKCGLELKAKEIPVKYKTHEDKNNLSEKSKEEPLKNFKLQKNVSSRQYGWTALIGIISGLILSDGLLGSILLLLGICSGFAWLFQIVKSKTLKVIILILIVLFAIQFFSGLFSGLTGQ